MSSHSSPQYSPQQYLANPPRSEIGGPLKYNVSSPRYKPNSPSTTIYVAPNKGQKPDNASPLSEEEEEEKKE